MFFSTILCRANFCKNFRIYQMSNAAILQSDVRPTCFLIINFLKMQNDSVKPPNVCLLPSYNPAPMFFLLPTLLTPKELEDF